MDSIRAVATTERSRSWHCLHPLVLSVSHMLGPKNTKEDSNGVPLLLSPSFACLQMVRRPYLNFTNWLFLGLLKIGAQWWRQPFLNFNWLFLFNYFLIFPITFAVLSSNSTPKYPCGTTSYSINLLPSFANTLGAACIVG